jgi:GNAT superfamily N-acetyltransferase
MSAASAAHPSADPTADVAVRPARLDDAAAIVDFNHRLALETEEKKLDHETLVKGVDAILRDPRLGRYFVAVEGDRVVGQMAVTEEWSDWRNGRLWWLQSVYVDAKWRGRGVFRLLLNKVGSLGRETGVVGLRLYVERTNQRAQQTYGRCGLRDAGYVVMERIPL